MKTDSKDKASIVSRSVTIKVKPSVRHVVSKAEETLYSDGFTGGTGGTICEVTNEDAANEIREALERLHAPRKYAVVQHSFEPDGCIVYYASSEAQAKQFQDCLQKHYGTDFRIFEQLVDMTQPLVGDVYGEDMIMVSSTSGVRIIPKSYITPADETDKLEGNLMVTRLANGRSVIQIEVPDHMTSTAAQKYVTDAMRRYKDSCKTTALGEGEAFASKDQDTAAHRR